MGGFFAVASKDECVNDLFFGTDYHSHLGTQRGGMAVVNSDGISRAIHDISNSQFRSKFEDDLPKLTGRRGIGVISDYEDQPILVGSKGRQAAQAFRRSRGYESCPYRPVENSQEKR